MSTLSLGQKLSHRLIKNKYNKYKKQYRKDQETIKSFDKIFRKSLQDNLSDENEFEPLCIISPKSWRIQKKNFFL